MLSRQGWGPGAVLAWAMVALAGSASADPAVQYGNALSYDVTHDADISWAAAGGANSNITLEVFLPGPLSAGWSEQSAATGESFVESPGAVPLSAVHLQNNADTDYLSYTINYQTRQPSRVRYTYSITCRNTTLTGGTFDDISATLSDAAGAAGLAAYRTSTASVAAGHADIVALKDAILFHAGIDPSTGLAKDAVKAFYDWIKAHLVYDYAYASGFEGTAKLTKYAGPFYSGSYSGQCGDYSSILIALCRAAGIPARPVVGYWVGGSANQTHVWAEVYFPSVNGGAGGWVPADATVDQGAGYAHLGQLADGNQRLIVAKGFDLTLNGGAAYACPLLQIYHWHWSYSGGAPVCTPSVSYSLTGTSASTTRTITATATEGGTIVPSGTVLVPVGGSQLFTFTKANANYLLSDVTVDGVSVGAPATYTLTNVTAHRAIAAVFAIDPAAYDGDGNGSADQSETNVSSVTTLNGSGGMTTVRAPVGATFNAAASHIATPGDAPGGISFPYGFVSFDLSVPAGSTSTVSVFVPYDARINGYWKRSGTGAYQNIATGIASTAGLPRLTRLDLSLTEGGTYDDDGLTNGDLVDPGGPGIQPLTASGGGTPSSSEYRLKNRFEVPFGGRWLYVLAVGACVWFASRRPTGAGRGGPDRRAPR